MLELGHTHGARRVQPCAARWGQAVFGDSLVHTGTGNPRYVCTRCATFAATRDPEHCASPCKAKNPLERSKGKWTCQGLWYLSCWVFNACNDSFLRLYTYLVYIHILYTHTHINKCVHACRYAGLHESVRTIPHHYRCPFPDQADVAQVTRAALQTPSKPARNTWAPPVRYQWERSPRHSAEELDSLQK